MSKLKEDFLNVDKPIPGQNFVCLSFISPEKTLKNKDIYFMSEFLKNLVTKLNEKNPDLNLEYNNVKKEYDDYLFNNKEDLEKVFFEENNFQTTVRGLKVRGIYDTRKEADIRSKVLQKIDSSHNVYIGQVGYWLPWDPEPSNIENEYLEDELNNLVKEYKENELRMDDYYQQNTRERAQLAKDQVDEIIGLDGIFKNEPIPTSVKNTEELEENEKEIQEKELN